MRILIRTVSFVAGYALFSLVAHLLFKEDVNGPNIGLGLALLALLVLTSGSWGLIDGTRMDFSRVALTWCSVAVAMAALVPVIPALVQGDPSWGEVVSDIAQNSPFRFPFIAVPALLGGLIGMALRSSRRPGDLAVPGSGMTP